MHFFSIHSFLSLPQPVTRHSCSSEPINARGFFLIKEMSSPQQYQLVPHMGSLGFFDRVPNLHYQLLWGDNVNCHCLKTEQSSLPLWVVLTLWFTGVCRVFWLSGDMPMYHSKYVLLTYSKNNQSVLPHLDFPSLQLDSVKIVWKSWDIIYLFRFCK